uniref:tRNA (guanine(9)-N(1))-methyltransferase n=1 Tax=Meloidogyne incognita TaxID=6306 RepID=A0A914MKQ2_MELIC
MPEENNSCNIVNSVDQKLSKRQKRREDRRQKFLEIRQELRKKKKERKRNEKKDFVGGGIRKQKFTMEQSNCRINIAVDMTFDELMDERTVRKTISQLAYCYAVNRRVSDPVQFSIVGLTGKAEKIFNSYPSYSNWDVNISNKNLDELWNPKQIVYLTADSNNLLETLNEDKVYIIGGLLDHNHHKGICLKKAEDNGYEHARLPIESFFKLCGRNVLTINQVFEILVNFCQSLDWKKAFLDVIPKRKGIGEEISIEYKKGEEVSLEELTNEKINRTENE